MNTRRVEAVIAPPDPHFVGDGFRVHNFIPGVPRLNMQRMDPFIMLDYNSKYYFSPTDKARGVGVHPHRGFETVTLAYEGAVAHQDSGGGGGVIRQGDVQWMTAASGVLHKEYHEESFSRQGGDFQMVQLWVNLPAKDKMTTPRYQTIPHGDIARHALENGKGTIEVVAGNYQGTAGPAQTFTPMHVLNAHLQAGGEADFSFPEDYSTALLVISGAIVINGQKEVPTDHLALLSNEGTDFSIAATQEATVLILSGAPIREPIAAHGPFVMNSREEILQAFDDFNTGKFGYLEN